MLVLTRKVGQTILLNQSIRVTLLECQGNRVRLGITAPPEVHIVREELLTDFQTVGEESSRSRPACVKG